MKYAIPSLFLLGCSDKQPARVAWISVEKPPIRVIYVDKQGRLDPIITTKMFNLANGTRYRDYKFNEAVRISIDANSHQSDTESDSDVSSIKVGRK